MQPAAQFPDIIADDDRFVDTAEAARILCLAEDTLLTWRNRKKGPPFYRFSTNKTVYLRSELIAWGLQYRIDNGIKIVPSKPGASPRPWESQT